MKIVMKNVADIKPRINSQRSKPRGVTDLVSSIKRVGLIHPIRVDNEGRLIAGGNRLEAFRRLGWAEIPTICTTLGITSDSKLMELEENLRRDDLTWREECLATLDLVESLQEIYPEWLHKDRADFIGQQADHMQVKCNMARELLVDNPLIRGSATFTIANNALKKESRRKIDNETNELCEMLNNETLETKQDTEEAELSAPPQDSFLASQPAKPRNIGGEILCADFEQWAATYRGKKFNLLHCDFPYGIAHGASGQGGAKEWGAYSDSPDVYWHLLKVLAQHRERLLYPTAHIMFWFSMKFYSETLEFFAEHMPEFKVDYQPLIWHKTDNKGIIRDIRHTPRNITETAFLLTRGDREIITCVANCYGAPTDKANATHISEKPVPVLRHFFRMTCDKYSEVLDPTCGSGSALRAAESMGVKRVVGLEINPEYAKTAQGKLIEARSLERYASKLNLTDEEKIQ